MEKIRGNWVFWAAAVTVVLTLASQYYWNASNYAANRERILKDVRFEFESAVDEYFARTSGANSYTIIDTRSPEDPEYQAFNFLDSLELDSLPSYFDHGTTLEQSRNNRDIKEGIVVWENITLVRGKTVLEEHPELLEYPNRMTFDIRPDSIPLDILEEEFARRIDKRELTFPFRLNYFESDSMRAMRQTGEYLWEGEIRSASEFLPAKVSISLQYRLPASSTFRKGLFGLLLSLILSGAVLFSLYYLIKTIERQKRLSEMKDDFIGNITHEFKTPIATASAALQALDKAEETGKIPAIRRYSDIAQGQLDKLHTMVEKLLETATLHTDQVSLSRERTDLSKHTREVIGRFQQRHPQLEMVLNVPQGSIWRQVDSFHWENSLINLLENAVKYGQRPVVVSLREDEQGIVLSVTDHGGNLSPDEAGRIFEKFYRIPRGKTHDVKGHGIGLYYAQTIIEKHGGNLTCQPDTESTTFEIALP